MSRLPKISFRPFKSLRTTSISILCLLLAVQMVFALCIPAIAAEGTTVMAVGSRSNVRAGAGTDNSIIGYAYAGTEYEYLGEATGTDGAKWYKFQYADSTVGWMSSSVSCKLTPEVKADPQKFIETVSKPYGAVGIQVATVNDGVVTDKYAVGWAVKNKQGMKNSSKIRTASLSKVVIAMTAMKMQEEGLVNMNTPIDGYWGFDLPKTITLRDLLTHTSTLSDLSTGNTPAELRAQLTRSSSYTAGTPGTAGVWRYCNYGAAIAGTTLEMASGTVIDSYADSRFFDSLGIDAAWMSGRVDTTELVNTYYSDGSIGRASSTSASLTGSDSPGYNAPYYAGGFTTSAAEYAKLIAILANDGTCDGVRYLEESSVAQMENGFFTATEHGGSFSQCLALRYKAGLYGRSGIYYHTGNAYGVLSLASYDDATRDGVVVITTGCTQGRDTQGIYSVCSIISKYFYDYMAARPRIPVENVSLDYSELQLDRDRTFRLNAKLTPAGANSTLKWTSSNPSCVTVSDDGVLTTVGQGSAVITVSAEGFSAQCTVTVIAPSKQNAPVLTEAFNSSTGVRVSWKPVSGAVKYRLLRKCVTTGETAWTNVGETTECTLIDKTAKSASRYTYTVECIDSSGKATSPRDETGRTCTYIAMPTITSVEGTIDGIKITWKKPAGAKNFRVMRKTDGGSWQVLTDVLGDGYVDTTAKSGVKYWYTVRAVTLAGDMYISSYNSYGWSGVLNTAPVLTEAFNSATGVRVSWKPVPGAVKYRLLRKCVTTGETKWTNVGEIAECTFIDTTAKSGSRYTFTVECITAGGVVTSPRDETGRTCTYIGMPKITAVKNVSGGVSVTWSKPAGAKNFRIMRKPDGGSWQILGDVLGNTYTDTTAKSGTKYWYTVRAVTLAGDMYISSYNSYGWSITKK